MQNWIWERICFGKFYPPGTPSKSKVKNRVKNDPKIGPKAKKSGKSRSF